jgi:hypothetical protein
MHLLHNGLEQLPPQCRTESDAAAQARRGGLLAYEALRRQRRLCWTIAPLLLLLLAGIIFAGLHDTFTNPRGEPFLITGGLSVWPTEIIRWLVLALAVCFVGLAFSAVQSGVIRISREYRLPLNPPEQKCPIGWVLTSVPIPRASIEAEKLWLHYQQLGTIPQRARRTLLPFALYFAFALGIFLLGRNPYSPVRGSLSTWIDRVTLLVSIIAFLFLVFWVMDSVRLCRWLIEQLSESYTRYPAACLRYFAERRALEDRPDLLEEWLDLRLIADLTEQVGRLIYYPFIVFFFVALARNQFWDRWTWPASLLIVFALNLALMVGSVVVLQRAAHRARDVGLDRLQCKVETAESKSAASPELHQSALAQKLIDEVRGLRKGAFVPFWENPIVGAILVPSGGTALIELLRYVWG